MSVTDSKYNAESIYCITCANAEDDEICACCCGRDKWTRANDSDDSLQEESWCYDQWEDEWFEVDLSSND